jgi:hypothetical protein
MLLVQIITIGLMFGLTFVIYKALGPPKRGLLYTREDKIKWDAFIKSHSLGGVLTIFNVVGTLTSLAGCYVFLMGSSKLFGYFIAMCSFTLIPGAYITNKFSKRIMASERLQALLASPNQTGGVIAALFWANNPAAQQTARLVKWVSILNLAAVLWMEFSVFAAIGKHLLGVPSDVVAPVLLFGCCFSVALFTLKYGLRGFVFADLFHVPLIALAAVAILGGAIVLSYQNWGIIPPVHDIISPKLPIFACALFALHNLCLNGLQLLTTEGHWLRLWIFRDQETRKLTRSTVLTGVVWGLLSAVGLLAYYLASQDIGVSTVAGLLSRLNELSVVFLAVFWIGGVAALFSTSDAQLYALMVVWNFNPRDGVLHDRAMMNIRPLFLATAISGAATAVYVILLHVLHLEIEKLVFLVFSLPLILFPAFVRAYRGLPQHPWYIILALVLYLGAAIAGLRQPRLGFEWTLAATLMPIAIAGIAAIGVKPDKSNESKSLEKKSR